MYSIGLGCLLEINDDNETVQLITGKGIETIISEEFDFRQNIEFFQDTVSRENIKKWNSLKNKNLLLYAQTIEELYECIKNLHPVRKGIRLKSEGKQYIVNDNQLNEATNTQSAIWQNSSGRKSLDEMFASMTKSDVLRKNNKVQEFVESIVGLVRAGVLYLLY